MKLPAIRNYCIKKYLSTYTTCIVDKSIRQKISHFSQQYSFFIALTMVQQIELYPDIADVIWEVDEKTIPVYDYNIFAYLLQILQCNEKDFSTNTTPLSAYIDMVIFDFMEFMLSECSLDSEGPLNKLPLTYEDFDQSPSNDNITKFFDVMTITFLEFTKEF
jgi:hypothetical protein